MEYIEKLNKLKTYYHELITDLEKTAVPPTGLCDPSHTGDGVQTSEELEEWNTWLEENEYSAIELAGYSDPSHYPEVAKRLWHYWLEDIHGFTWATHQAFPTVILDSLMIMFAMYVAKAIFDKDTIFVEE